MKLRCRDHVLDLDRVVVMGVLNVTPDSFSDGGLWLDADAAIAHGLDMAAKGAGIIDVGGESTRPGAEPVELGEELRRVIPVIEALSTQLGIPIAIDTRKAEVADAALEAGASIINDTTGEPGDGGLDPLARNTGAAMIVMHSRGSPATMRSLATYGDVVSEVAEWLKRRARELETMGVEHDAIVLDPGFGFAKTPAQNLELLRRLDQIVALGYPVLAGTSRKSFIGEVLDAPVEKRVEGTAATVAWATAEGARIVRVHDVAPMIDVVRMIEAIGRTVDRITIRDLRLQTRVGVTDEERARPQSVVIGIEIEADLSAAGVSDELGDTIDYGTVVTEVAALLRNGESRLLEHLAQQIASHVVRMQGVRAVTVEVSKESPPIAEDVGPIGIRIERSAE